MLVGLVGDPERSPTSGGLGRMRRGGGGGPVGAESGGRVGQLVLLAAFGKVERPELFQPSRTPL